jgi:hypothetical protein
VIEKDMDIIPVEGTDFALPLLVFFSKKNQLPRASGEIFDKGKR